MRTDLAQYYQSKKPSLRLQYMTSADEKVNFEINGTDLLLRDINIFCTTKANHRAMLDQMKQLIVGNNTAGATIFDLGNVMQAESLAELNHVLKATDKKAQKIRQEDMQHEQQMKDSEIESANQQKQMELDHKSMEAEKDRRKDVLVAEIKSAGYGAMQDIDKNLQSDFADQMAIIKSSDEFDQTMNFDQQKERSRVAQTADKATIAREKIQAQKDMKQTDLQIAMTNKNKFDVKPPKKSEKKKK
jgi:hypothetical protein